MSELLFALLCSYFQKVPAEAPQLELKASYGLVEPVPFEFPPTSTQWTPEALAAFDLTSRPKDDSVRARSSIHSHKRRRDAGLASCCVSPDGWAPVSGCDPAGCRASVSCHRTPGIRPGALVVFWRPASWTGLFEHPPCPFPVRQRLL